MYIDTNWYNYNIIYVPVEQEGLKRLPSAITDFHREVDETFAFLGYHAASSGNFLPTSRENISVRFSGVKNPKQGFLTLEDGNDRLSRDISKKLPLLAAWLPRKVKVSGRPEGHHPVVEACSLEGICKSLS